MRREQTEGERRVQDVKCGASEQSGFLGGPARLVDGRTRMSASCLPAPCTESAHLCCEVDIVEELRVGQVSDLPWVTRQAGRATGMTPGSPGFCPFPSTCRVLAGRGHLHLLAGLFWALLFRESCHALHDNSVPPPGRNPGQQHPPSAAPITLPFLPQPSGAFLPPLPLGRCLESPKNQLRGAKSITEQRDWGRWLHLPPGA